MTLFADLHVALEQQQVALAERLEAMRQAEAALAHLHDVLAMPVPAVARADRTRGERSGPPGRSLSYHARDALWAAVGGRPKR
jgi:hypothetical protein